MTTIAVIRMKATTQVGCNRRRTPSIRLMTGPILAMTAITEVRYDRRRAARGGIAAISSFPESGVTSIHLSACNGILGGEPVFVKLLMAGLKASKEECKMFLKRRC